MHFGKRSNEQLEENVANEPLLPNEAIPDVTDEDIEAALARQLPVYTDGFNRFVLFPVSSGNRAYANIKRAVSKFQEESPAVGRDNVFMHFG